MIDKANILVVDDSSESLGLLVKILIQAGYQVYPADSGALALETVAINKPDLILLDVCMKGVDGLEVCRRLKAHEETRSIPIILISAFADVKEWVLGLQLGAADYITKPFQTEELLTRIKTHLSLRRANLSLEQQSASLQQINEQLQSEIVKRQRLEDELRPNLERDERSRRALLSTLEDQKQVEDSLRTHQKQLEEAQRIGQLGNWEWDVATNVATWSDEMYRIFGRDRKSSEFTLEAFLDAPHPDDRTMVRGRVQKSFETHEPTDFDFRIITPNGELRWVNAISTMLVDDNGKPKRVFGTCQDITNRKKGEESRLLLTTALESAANGVSITDRQGNIVWINKAFTAMTGYTWTEVVGQNPRILKSGKQDDSFYKELWETISAGNVWTGELINRKKDGTLYNDGTTITPLKNANGEITNFIAIRQDITERKKREREIRIFGHAIKSIGECISITDLDNKVLFVNEAFLRTYGYEERELLGKTIGMVRSDKNKTESESDILQATLKGSWQGEVVNRRKDGSEFPVSLSTSMVTNDEGQTIALIGVATDITERKRAEEAVKESEERFRILFEYAPDAYYLNDLKGTFIDGNKAAEELTGYTRQELIGKNMLSLHLLQPNQVVKVAALLAQSVFGRPTGPDELNLRRKSGTEITAEIRTYPVKVKDKTLILGIARDITKRRQAEEALRTSEERFRSIYESSPVGIVSIDESGKFLRANAAAQKILGYSETELQAVSFNDITFSEDREIGVKALEAITRGGKDSIEIEKRYVHKDGHLVSARVTISALRDSHGKLANTVTLLEDISERKKAQETQNTLEQRLAQAQKMEAIGTLAGGIAHDFNNILGIILGHLSIVIQPDYDGPMRTASAETITNAVRRGANLVRQILTFARKTEVTIVPVNVNESVREIRKMLEATFPKSIAFTVDVEKGLPFVLIDAGQLHQALLNLCVNARDAIAEAPKRTDVEPRITIKTAVVMGKVLRERFPEVSAEQYAAISVADTGAGMDETTRKRIFEPFFTTKEKGKGTGLGLAVVYGVVKSARGIVDVQSEPGRGSVFTLYLPIPKEASLSEPKPEKQQMEVRGGSDTILIVEDEETMLAVLKLSLQNKGYKILSAVDGREALDRFTENKESIHLVITDLGLPKLSGEILIREMKQLKPSIKIIVASGFIDPDQRTELLALGAKDIIMKPYDQTEVLEKVREVLDAR